MKIKSAQFLIAVVSLLQKIESSSQERANNGKDGNSGENSSLSLRWHKTMHSSTEQKKTSSKRISNEPYPTIIIKRARNGLEDPNLQSTPLEHSENSANPSQHGSNSSERADVNAHPAQNGYCTHTNRNDSYYSHDNNNEIIMPNQDDTPNHVYSPLDLLLILPDLTFLRRED
ncbi:hypothetical protein NEMIN01_1619 [Nematocida minor]|uniref:uncharacterized protein n=1 Tax=Nematocida minor TaxID=1912983 RepID=UPI00221FF225|nr:uncharacterized protein NEMIN01_1619 [Nematocida minor]KAI5191686.1 hypothetical protein NEMIN01_1619 [Nematocida minor]